MTTVSTSTGQAAATAAAPASGPMPLGRALNAGMRQALATNDRVLLMGEDIGRLGGVFRVTEGLQAEFGEQRVLDTPLAESGIVGTAIGLAMAGFRPVCEIQFDGFVFPAFDQITSQLAKMTNRLDGAVPMPVVIRIPYGGHIGAIEHHQESPEAYFTHTPGLRVVSPATAGDAYWMIQEAIASNDPVIFLEPKSAYWQKGEVDTTAPALPLHASRVVRRGTDVTLVGHGAMVGTLLQAAALAESEGTSCEVVDLAAETFPVFQGIHFQFQAGTGPPQFFQVLLLLFQVPAEHQALFVDRVEDVTGAFAGQQEGSGVAQGLDLEVEVEAGAGGKDLQIEPVRGADGAGFGLEVGEHRC